MGKRCCLAVWTSSGINIIKMEYEAVKIQAVDRARKYTRPENHQVDKYEYKLREGPNHLLYVALIV